jgi:hypothetical protein
MQGPKNKNPMKQWQSRCSHSLKSQNTCWLQWKPIFALLWKKPLLVFNDSITHILELCLHTNEIEVLWIWSHRTMLLKFFFINKIVVDTMFIRSSLKIECIQTYTKFFQNYCGFLTYFIKMATCVDHFRCTFIGSCIECCWFLFWTSLMTIIVQNSWSWLKTKLYI